MKTFYTIGNLNFKTIELVAKSIFAKFGEHAFDKMVLLNSLESAREQVQQVEIYRKYIHTDFSVLGITVNKDGKIRHTDLVDIFSSDCEKIVDLSNGQKVTSSILYMAASLCNVDDIYYLILHKKPLDLPVNPIEKIDYDYMKIGKFTGIQSLSKISFFDLIYYNEEAENIFNEQCLPNSLYMKAKKGLLKGIKDFFDNQIDGRSAINNITIGNEGLINATYSYLSTNPFALKFAQKTGIFFRSTFDPVGVIQKFYTEYTKDKNHQNKDLVVLRTLPSLMSTLRAYRNLTAHSSMHTHEFSPDEVRIAVNMMLEAFRCAKQNADLWKKVKGDS